MELEKIARKYVQGLKDLYVNASVYGIVSLISLLVWLSFGGGGFWPIWVFLAFGIATVLQGWSIGSIKQLEEILPFLKPEWEEQQLKKLLKQPVSTKIHPDESKKKDEKPVPTYQVAQAETINEENVTPRQKNIVSTIVSEEKKAAFAPKTNKTASQKKTPSKKKPTI